MSQVGERRAMPRTAWVLGGLGLGAAIAVSQSVLGEPPDTSDTCLLDESPARRAWNDEVRRTVAANLTASPTRIDPTSVLERLDAYADGLAWVATDRCWAARAKGREFDTRSPQALCLLGAAERLEAVATLLAEGETPMVGGAESMVAALPPVDSCLDQRRLRSIRPLPPSPGRVGQALLANKRLARLEMLIEAGARAHARDSLEDVREAVDEADHAPAWIEFTLLRARLLSASERSAPEEISVLRDTAAKAEAMGADQHAARLLALQLLSLRETNDASADVLAPIVFAKIERCGDPLSAAWLDGRASP